MGRKGVGSRAALHTGWVGRGGSKSSSMRAMLLCSSQLLVDYQHWHAPHLQARCLAQPAASRSGARQPPGPAQQAAGAAAEQPASAPAQPAGAGEDACAAACASSSETAEPRTQTEWDKVGADVLWQCMSWR